jgi:tRNA (guanine37-N1)-methyltransferase
MRFDVLTLFPDFFRSPLDSSLIGKAVKRGVVEVSVTNVRDFAPGAHRMTDDAPYGGGSGMVMRVEPLVAAIEAAGAGLPVPRRLLLSPRGRPLRQAIAEGLAREARILLVCGRYEGVDERVLHFVDDEISVGDYVLAGGETAALVIIDAVTRLLPGFVGNAGSLEEESFRGGLLEYPQYTRPETFRDLAVPAVLLSGDHGAIARWRRMQRLRLTRERRPDLLESATLADEDRLLLREIEREDD